ncbi:MAG: hypothetical protein AAF802_21610 [Planctomycetota bacterium]
MSFAHHQRDACRLSMTWFLRSLLLFAFALLWGGLTFYTGFVVPISTRLLSDPFESGLVTQQVTNVLQVLGVLTGLMMLANSWLVLKTAGKPGLVLLTCSGVLLVSIAVLYATHLQLDAVIDASALDVTDRESFDAGHRRYSQWTTVEWLCCVIYLPTTLAAWNKIDGKTAAENGEDQVSQDAPSGV